MFAFRSTKNASKAENKELMFFGDRTKSTRSVKVSVTCVCLSENRAKLGQLDFIPATAVSLILTEPCFIALRQWNCRNCRTIRWLMRPGNWLAAVYEIHLGDKKPKEIPRQNHPVKKMQKYSTTARDHDMLSSSGVTWISYAVESSSLAVLDPVGRYESRERR